MYPLHGGITTFCSAATTSFFNVASHRYPEIRSRHEVIPFSAQPKNPECAWNQYASTGARGPAPSSPGSNVPANAEFGRRLLAIGRNMATLGCDRAGNGSHLSGAGSGSSSLRGGNSDSGVCRMVLVVKGKSVQSGPVSDG
ncbi:unnamed protein product [Periconia digitata]|uniref:Uncharacterized protein n=1 Tax=Periconia digitata TaxID=1303443 RepID=A0A9W4UGZ3_9PLEO|nr:unnamed protein product [Periconia digitata]